MYCYGCKVELFGFQAYQSMYCSQCLNRRAVEKQTLLQAQIAERQYEMQQEQLRDMEEQRELMESRNNQPYRSTIKPAYYYGNKILSQMSAEEIMEEYKRSGHLPDPNEM